jgi:hypothetical protein
MEDNGLKKWQRSKGKVQDARSEIIKARGIQKR